MRFRVSSTGLRLQESPDGCRSVTATEVQPCRTVSIRRWTEIENHRPEPNPSGRNTWRLDRDHSKRLLMSGTSSCIEHWMRWWMMSLWLIMQKTNLPSLVMIISVPIRLNSSHNSAFSKVIWMLGSLFTDVKGRCNSGFEWRYVPVVTWANSVI